jgi:antitoxin component HigA of HigAB toxin-antitoxin module
MTVQVKHSEQLPVAVVDGDIVQQLKRYTGIQRAAEEVVAQPNRLQCKSEIWASWLLEQCKSALSHNAVSDWSEDLWKALANWLDWVASGKIDANNTSFQLYVTPPRVGKLSSAMHAAREPLAVHALVKEVEKKLKARAEPPRCIAHVRKFLDASDAHRDAVISRFSAISVDDDPIEPLRVLLAPAIPTDSIDVICQSAIGIAKEWADRRIPLLGTASRVSEVLTGKRELSMTMVRKLRERFHIPADLLIPPLRPSEIAA